MPSTSTHTGAAATAPAAAAIFPGPTCPSGAGGGRGPDVTRTDPVVAPLPPGTHRGPARPPGAARPRAGHHGTAGLEVAAPPGPAGSSGRDSAGGRGADVAAARAPCGVAVAR